jgi:hypothetical protein
MSERYITIRAFLEMTTILTHPRPRTSTTIVEYKGLLAASFLLPYNLEELIRDIGSMEICGREWDDRDSSRHSLSEFLSDKLDKSSDTIMIVIDRCVSEKSDLIEITELA